MVDSIVSPDVVRTFTGRFVNVFNPEPYTIEIRDIAHALSNLCRFGGHTRVFYSVAQHCVQCAGLVRSRYKLQALLHDAAEAYLIDVPKPLKYRYPGYEEMENKVMTVIARKYRFQYPVAAEVKDADKAMLVTEWCSLMIGKDTIMKWSPEEAEEHFLRIFYRYGNSQI